MTDENRSEPADRSDTRPHDLNNAHEPKSQGTDFTIVAGIAFAAGLFISTIGRLVGALLEAIGVPGTVVSALPYGLFAVAIMVLGKWFHRREVERGSNATEHQSSVLVGAIMLVAGLPGVFVGIFLPLLIP